MGGAVSPAPQKSRAGELQRDVEPQKFPRRRDFQCDRQVAPPLMGGWWMIWMVLPSGS